MIKCCLQSEVKVMHIGGKRNEKRNEVRVARDFPAVEEDDSSITVT